MTFLELLQSGAEMDCDLIIGDCDMPATFVWYGDMIITEYGIQKFKPIMDAEFRRIPNGNIEIFCDDWRMGERFTLAAAGYISETEYDMIFKEK